MFIPIFHKPKHFGKCPGCEKLNDIDLDTCNHCQRKFSQEDQLAILTYANAQKEKGNKMAVYLGVVLLVGLGIAAILK